MNKLTLPMIDDWHHHVRTGPTINLVLKHLTRYCARAIIMPNLKPPVCNGDDVSAYQNEIEIAQSTIVSADKFEPLMTIAIHDNTSVDDIYSAHVAGAVAGKIYPKAVTTNSEDGLVNHFSSNMLKVYAAMKEVGMLLLHHGEIAQAELLYYKREDAYLPIFWKYTKIFPDQRQVLEHISTKNAVDLINMIDSENVAATITAHHLTWTGNDVLGDGVHPHKVCMPCMKTFPDLYALIAAAISGSPHFFYGSDSAPHIVTNKECAHGACGQFTVPVALPMLVAVFEKADALAKLAYFTSGAGADFYGLPRNTNTITLIKKEWPVPMFYGDPEDRNFQFVPPNAGEHLQWQLDG